MKKSAVINRLILITGIIIVVNLISEQLFFRLDFTSDKRYTLSEATKNILNELEDVITVTAYFTEDLPPQLMSTRQDFRDLLIEYETRSGGNIVYEFINPNVSESKEQEAQQNGIGPILVNVRESDQVKQMRAYLGVVLQMGDKRELIPVVQPGAAMEYDLTTSIKKLSLSEKPKLALIQGHGEPSLNAIPQLMQQLSVLYDVEPYTLTDTADIPSYYKTIMIIEPQDTIPASHLNKIDHYIRGNGNVFIAYGNLRGDLSQARLFEAPDIGIKFWLGQKGIALGSNFLIDATSGSVSVQQRQGPFIMTTQVQFPYFPIIGNFADHPAAQGLESLILPLVSNITINENADSTLSYTPLAFSSEQSGLIPAPVFVDINREWQEQDFNLERQAIAMAVEGPINGAASARMVVVANGNFCVNGEQGQQQQLNEDNINFASNAIDWLSDDTGLIDLRTKGITNRPLDPIEDSTKAMLRWGNVIAPILIILIYAFIRRQQFMKKRQNWLQGNY